MSRLELTRGIRLDQKVIELIPKLSRAFASQLIEEGKVRVNQAVVTKSGYKLKREDSVIVDFDPAELERLPAIDIPIIFEDDDSVIINKPIGVLTHSKGAFNPEATVASWLRSRYQGSWSERAGIVHRLDRATSGVMICAKNIEATRWLQKQFSQRKVKKTYIAIVNGSPKHQEAIIDMPLERNPKAPATFKVGSQGKPAITHYKVVKTHGTYTMLELQPETGRTHQLRVHLASLGLPIVGDLVYGGQTADRLYLHALKLEITLLSRRRAVFEAPLPKEFNSKIKGK